MKIKKLRLFACIVLLPVLAAGCSLPFIAASIEGKRGTPAAEAPSGGNDSDEVDIPIEFEW
jgi:hypothetical protein